MGDFQEPDRQIREGGGIKVVFVECPEYSGRRARDAEKYNRELKEYAEEKGIPFLNYNAELLSELNDAPENYSDWGHMSLKGSTAFSKMLAEDLAPVLDRLLESGE